VPSGGIAHPGCFTTAVTLSLWPLLSRGLAEPRFQVSAVTGSTGAGREPTAATHHPFRHANLRAYQALHHRHEPEMRRLLRGNLPRDPEIVFVPHSGPFARGIHVTAFARLRRSMTGAELREAVRAAYAGQPFVDVLEEPPALKDVVGTNRFAVHAEARGQDALLLGVLDNLVKGAAGGAIQWMNRALGLPETAGLTAPALGWS
jgi:N-acetyl-gamma-glutamyl-phosphate reductase